MAVYCPLIRNVCKGKMCIAYNVNAEFNCLIFALLYRLFLEIGHRDM